MATVNKDFRVKHGLVVEGTSATVDGNQVLTEASTDFINDQVGNILENASQTNISISYDDATNELSIVAENGVADSTTDDLDEGTTNLYFTSQRAIDAVGGSATSLNTPNTVVKRDVNGDFAAGEISADLLGNVTGQVSDISNHDTGDLTEGTNLYFTDERAQDAVGNAVGTGLSYNDSTGAISVDTATIQARVADVSDTEIGYLNGVTSAIQTQLDNKLALAGGTLTGALTLHADPGSALHAVTKQYVDNTASGIVAKPQVLGATTANIDATYDNGTLGVGATLTHNTNGAFPTSAGGAEGWAVGKGILVKNQTNKAQNGRYYVSDMGSPSTPYVLTRCGYCDEASEIPGAYIFVQDGTNAGTGWVQTVADATTFTVGTDDIDVYQFSGSGTITAGTGITVDGLTVSVDRTTVDTWYDPAGSATTAETNSKAYTDDLIGDVTVDGTVGDTVTDRIATAKSEAQSYADGLAVNYDPAGSASAAESNANNYTDTLTDDILDGTTSFSQVNVNNIAREVASSQLVVSAGTVNAVSWNATTAKSAKAMIKFANATDSQISEVLLTLDSSNNIAITEFAEVRTNGVLGTVSASYDSGSNIVSITGTTSGSNITVIGYATLIA